MNYSRATLSLIVIAASLSACGSRETVIERPVLVSPPHVAPTMLAPDGSPKVPGTGRSVEELCENGYSNETRSCY